MYFFCLILSLLSAIASASENGGYYTCDATALATDNKCIFALTDTAPTDWVTPAQKHDIDRDVGENFYRGVQSYTGDMLSVSPKPWVNGDVLVGTEPDAAVTGDDWSYTLIFEMIAPLRDMMMYDPDELTEDVWNKYTRALTDCKSKFEDYTSRSGGSPYSTDQVYAYLKNPDYSDIHHYILQYLEEGAMDLVCLSTNLVMDHCDTIRGVLGAVSDTEGGQEDRCNCWFDAYKAIYDACPAFDMPFSACNANYQTGSQDCADEEATDTSGFAVATPGVGEPPAKGSGPPSR